MAHPAQAGVVVAKVVLHDESDLTLAGPDVHCSALQLFATSLALCTASVLAAHGENIDAPIDDLVLRVRWDCVDRPYRALHHPPGVETRVTRGEG